MSDQMPGLRGQHCSHWLTSETRIPRVRFLREYCLQVTFFTVKLMLKPTQKKKKVTKPTQNRNISVFTHSTVIIQYVIFSVNPTIGPACIFGSFDDQMF